MYMAVISFCKKIILRLVARNVRRKKKNRRERESAKVCKELGALPTWNMSFMTVTTIKRISTVSSRHLQSIDSVRLRTRSTILLSRRKLRRHMNMTEQLAVPRRASRDKSPIQEKIQLFTKCATQGENPSKLGELEYGRPVVGSKTEARGLKAHAHVFREILELCEIINSDGDIRFRDDDGNEQIGILFGDLFRIYTVISDKCVGLLLRARKHHLVVFEGETLFQRRDDNTPIFLTKSIEEIREILFPSAKGEENTVPWHTGVTSSAT